MTEQITETEEQVTPGAAGGTNVPPEPQSPEPETDEEGTGQEPETFPREYVTKLRDEAAKHRTRAQRTDDLAARLHGALVAATGRLADPSDLPFEESHLDDAEALTTAIDKLLTRKPHLASRRVSGDVGQGASASADTVDLAGILRSRAS